MPETPVAYTKLLSRECKICLNHAGGLKPIFSNRAYKKWAQITPALQVGDIVLVSDDRLPRLRWKLGRIQELFKGRDGLVRSALIRTSQGVFRRPITVLHTLEAADKPSRQERCLF